MMLPKSFNKNQSLGATEAVAKKKGLSFSPLMVVALAAFIHLFIGLSLIVSVILAVIISMAMIVRNAMKKQSNLPPIPPKENIETQFEPIAGSPFPGTRDQAQPIQTNKRSNERLPDLLDSNDWGRDAPEPTEVKKSNLPPKYERVPVERLSQSLPKRVPARPSSVLQALTPDYRRKSIQVPNLRNEAALHQAIIAMVILGPCKANESDAELKQLI
jgi:hypothetical protein